jgi:Ni,Fe-hydrogenase III large subunit
MLSQMWNIQTDSERARWAHNDVELLEKASIDLEVEVVKDVPKRAKSTKKKKDVTTKETQLTPVLELPENTATTTSVDSISRVAVMEEEVLTPVQLPTKAMSKRQKRSKLIDEEIEKQDNIQGTIPYSFSLTCVFSLVH